MTMGKPRFVTLHVSSIQHYISTSGFILGEAEKTCSSDVRRGRSPNLKPWSGNDVSVQGSCHFASPLVCFSKLLSLSVDEFRHNFRLRMFLQTQKRDMNPERLDSKIAKDSLGSGPLNTIAPSYSTETKYRLCDCCLYVWSVSDREHSREHAPIRKVRARKFRS